MQLNFPSNYIWTRRKIIFDLSRRELIRKSFSKSVECADQSWGLQARKDGGDHRSGAVSWPGAAHGGGDMSAMSACCLSHRQWSLRHASHTFPWQHLLAYTFGDKSPFCISKTTNRMIQNYLTWKPCISSIYKIDRSGWSCVHCVHLPAGSPGSVAAWLFPLKINVCIGLTFPR